MQTLVIRNLCETEKLRYYARVIQKLQNELAIKGADSTETRYLLSIIVIMTMLTKSSCVSIA
jgi:hypothetical protein